MVTRCIVCNKKIPEYLLTAYRCKCKGIYCTEHKFTHDCTFDYNAEFKEKMKEAMPVVQARKVNPL